MQRLMSAAAALILIAAPAASMAQPRHDDHHNDQHNDHHPNYPHHDWHNGGRIERGDWNRGSHVDYRARHLRAPPRGYEWREVDGNYVLAAAATGLIASIIASSH